MFLECHCLVQYVHVDVGDSTLLQFMGTASLAAGKTSHLVSIHMCTCVRGICMSVNQYMY